VGLRQLGGAVEQQLAAVEAEHLDRHPPALALADDLAVVEEDKLRLGIIVARIEQKRPFLVERWAQRLRLCAALRDREARAFGAAAVGAAWQQVLPLVGEPPVVVGADSAVEIDGRRPRSEVLDLKRPARPERRFAVGAFAGAQLPERLLDLRLA